MSSRRRAKTGAPKTGAPKTGAPKTGAPKTGASKSGARANPRTRSTPRRPPAPARDFWGVEGSEDREPAPIRPTPDPTALIQSLGPPPLPHSTAARHYFDAVYERAAALAIALATSVDLVEPGEPDEPEEPDRS